MLKTFEMKMKQHGIKRIAREYQGRTRYDTWLMDCGIEFLTIHSNEHLSALTINTYTVAKALAESKDQYFTLKGFEEVMKFLDITYLPVHQNGEFLGHGLYFQPKETWFTSVAKDGRLIANSGYAGMAVAIGQDVYDDLESKGIISKLKQGEVLNFDPVDIAKWVEAHPQSAYRITEFIEGINERIMRENSKALMESAIGEWAKDLGLNVSVEMSSPEELAKELREMQNSPNNLGSGFAFFNSDGTEMNQDNATVEEFVEAVTGVKVEKPIEPESNLPS